MRPSVRPILLALAVAASAACLADNTAEPPGPLNAYDAVAGYGGVAAYAGAGAELMSLRILHLRSDGTIDLEAEYAPSAIYEFVRPEVMSPEKEKLPVGARGKAGGLEGVEVTIRKPGTSRVIENGVSRDERHLGMDRHVRGSGYSAGDHVPAPTCSLKSLWKAAIAAGAPKDAVADVTYDVKGWSFAIGDVDFKMHRTGPDCAEEKKGAEGRGD